MSFLIFLKGLDWQIDGALKTAALAFLAAWAVFAFVIYISNAWDKRRPLMIAGQIALAMVLALVWWAYLPPSALAPQGHGITRENRITPENGITRGLTPNTSQDNDSLFTEITSVQDVDVILGGSQIGVPVKTLYENYQVHLPFRFGSKLEPLPVHLQLVEGKLYADVAVFQAAGKPVITLKRNEFSVHQSGWDRNQSKNALEIVDEEQRPMLQIVYETPSRIVINGVFPVADGYVIAGDKGLGGIYPYSWSYSETLKQAPITPIFKYPSWKYPGVYVE